MAYVPVDKKPRLGDLVDNFDVLAVIYLGGWSPVTLIGYAASRWFTRKWSPPAHPLFISVLAGAVWPLSLIGLVELASIVVYAKVEAKLGSDVAVIA